MRFDEKIYDNKSDSNSNVTLISTLPTQSKLVLFSILLQNKINNQAGIIKTITIKEIFSIYKELCKKTKNNCLSKRSINQIIQQDLKELFN